jgi:hypothetical protein
MDTDFPAAHSMDTHWFAVDSHGRVGLFFTGENGFIPSGANEADSYRLVEFWHAISDQDPPGVEDEDVEDWDLFLDGLAEQGLFYFNYADEFDAPEPLLNAYATWCAPDQPLHVSQLPPQWRRLCGTLVLGTANFGEGEQIQPLDGATEMPVTWSQDVCAYLSADEKVIRPLPGCEEPYRQFCQEYADQLREYREGVRIEGVDENKPASDATGG